MEFRLRPWKLDDLDRLVALANNPRIAGFMTNVFPHPYTAEDGRIFLQRVLQDDPSKILAVEVDGEIVGSVGIFPLTDIFCKNAEIGYWIGEPYWGRGIAVKAVQEICIYGTMTWNLHRLFARPFGSNLRSKRVLEKAGFDLEAHLKESIYKNGVYEDELIYSILMK
jgi:RimJ/RimL family protein N-acetyltransferase